MRAFGHPVPRSPSIPSLPAHECKSLSNDDRVRCRRHRRSSPSSRPIRSLLPSPLRPVYGSPVIALSRKAECDISAHWKRALARGPFEPIPPPRSLSSLLAARIEGTPPSLSPRMQQPILPLYTVAPFLTSKTLSPNCSALRSQHLTFFLEIHENINIGADANIVQN